MARLEAVLHHRNNGKHEASHHLPAAVIKGISNAFNGTIFLTPDTRAHSLVPAHYKITRAASYLLHSHRTAASHEESP